MEKLIRYYSIRGQGKNNNNNTTQPEYHDFPDLTAAEEAEVINELELDDAVKRTKTKKTAKDLITGTLRSFKQYRPTETEIIDDDENEFEEFGTVRIKKTNGEDSFGTLRVKKDSTGTPIFKIFEEPIREEENHESADFSTFKVNKGRDDGSDDDGDGDGDFSTFKVGSLIEDEKETIRQQIQQTSKLFIYRKPEDWEMNIIALERGEWVQGMEEKKRSLS